MNQAFKGVRSASTACLFALCCTAAAQETPWYVGFGGGGSRLDPSLAAAAGTETELDDTAGTLLTLYVGRDIDRRTGVQLQLYDLGDATFDIGDEVSYRAADASVVYRFFDSADRPLAPADAGLRLYGRFGLGWMDRNSSVDLDDDARAYFGVGGGAEWLWNRLLGVRGELFYHDVDVASAKLSLVLRFGGRAWRDARATRQVPTGRHEEAAQGRPDSDDATAAPQEGREDESAVPGPVPDDAGAADPADTPDGEAEAPLIAADAASPPSPGAVETDVDRDRDGVVDAEDACPGSSAAYPVRADGCALFEGVLSGVQFAEGTADLLERGREQLDILAGMLLDYPETRIELHAHTDNRGSPRSQAMLTRERLRTIGMYLLEKGVSARRLVLRSFGGSRPVIEADTRAAHAANNRIEIYERVD